MLREPKLSEFGFLFEVPVAYVVRVACYLIMPESRGASYSSMGWSLGIRSGSILLYAAKSATQRVGTPLS